MIESSVILFGLILARAGTFVAMMPLFGGRQVPRMVKVGLALALAAMWFGGMSEQKTSDASVGYVPSPLYSGERVRVRGQRISLESNPSPQPSPLSTGERERSFRESSPSWLALGVALGREAALGAILGFAFGLVLVPARVAGEYIGQEMGLSLASLADPMAEGSAGLLGQVFEMLGVLVFFGLDGHHVFLAAMHASFARVPVGGSMGPVPVVALVSGAAAAQEWGLLLAAPLAACLFITSVVLALMARAAPQLNIMTVGFALRLAVGLVAMFVLMPELGFAMGGVAGRVADVLRGVL